MFKYMWRICDGILKSWKTLLPDEIDHINIIGKGIAANTMTLRASEKNIF